MALSKDTVNKQISDEAKDTGAANTDGAANTGAGAEAGGVNVGTETGKKGKKDTGSAQLARKGLAAISAMPEEDRKLIGSKSGTVVFNHLLGQDSNKSSRRVGKNQSETCATTVGANVTVKEDVLIPVVDINRNQKTGLEEGDVTYRTAKAGETFDMSLMELMLLMTRDEFGGFIATKDNAQGVRFSPKVSAYFDAKQALPTPALNLVAGAIKASIVSIDYKEGDTWKIRPDYEKKFGDLMKKSTPSRTSGSNKTKVSTTTQVAKAVQALLPKAPVAKAEAPAETAPAAE